MNAFDQLMCDALPLAAVHLGAHADAPSFLEAYLEEAFVAAVPEARPGASAETSGRSRVSIPDWDRPLGGFDLRVRLDGDEAGEALVEAKVDDVDQSLWDLFKLAAALSLPGVEAAYLLVARHRDRWDDGDCAALFAPAPEPVRWDSAAIFERWRRAWADLLRGGAARPTSVPSEVETAFVGRAPAAGFERHELRCVAVRLVPGAAALPFAGDWPAPPSPG
jgi:hypothetical protein